MRTNKHKNQGFKDGKNKQFNPPSKGTSKTKSTLIGIGVGAIGGPVGMLIGGVIGNVLGDSKEELKQKKKANGSYRHGNSLGRKNS